MKFTLSTKIGMIGFILVLIIALTTVMVGAQTVTVTQTGTPTPSTPVWVSSFTVDISQTSGGSTPNTASDVKISVKINNFNITTQTPTSTATPTKAQGLIKYSYDMPVVAPGASGAALPSVTSSLAASIAASAAAQSPVPTATNTTIQAFQPLSFLSTSTNITLTQVTAGVHTFSVELVKNDGSSMNPPIFFNAQMYVISSK